ncbi:MAG TPA: 2OG-Fe(II) oxygenase [Chitinophagaceae bacterium]|nr:2OG-Fe(II) oxygenase [Chitinophagaceae bacterium]
MKNLQHRISSASWPAIIDHLNDRGFAMMPGILNSEDCEKLVQQYNQPEIYRKTIFMERYRFGKGEYKYYKYPLPEIIQTIRQSVYPYLAPVANGWMKMLNIDKIFPDSFDELLALCRQHKQVHPTALVLQYGPGGFNTLHQDLYGEIFFPMQVVMILDEPGKDYTGGEFVLTEQIPRAQSKAIVLNPKKGDLLIFTTQFRPAKGSKGYYRVNMKHGVSELHSGRRHSLGIIFHDALS